MKTRKMHNCVRVGDSWSLGGVMYRVMARKSSNWIQLERTTVDQKTGKRTSTVNDVQEAEILPYALSSRKK